MLKCGCPFQGDNYHPEKPKDGSLPKYWNNDPKLDEANSKAFLEMAHMKAEVKKHKEKIKQEQVYTKCPKRSLLTIKIST
jgi:hypothetical protein